MGIANGDNRIFDWDLRVVGPGGVCALLLCASCTSTPPAARDSTLAALSAPAGDGWLEVTADLAGHVSGQLAPYMWDDLDGTFDSTDACPRLHARVSANGVEGAWTEVGSGTQLPGTPVPGSTAIFRCRMPAFQVTVPGGLGDELDVRIRDESTQWIMRIRVYRPTATLVGDAGLPSGRWADLRLDPPSSYVVLDFDSDAGCAHFELTSSRDGTGCTTDYATSVNCDAGLLEAAAGCPVTFNDAGVSFLVPDVGAASGTFGVRGWPQAELLQCEGLATCWLNNAAGIGGATGPYVDVPAETTP